MELWIRSQAKNKLLKVACMEVKQFEDGYGIVELIGSGDTGYGLGIYKTKERALEVLAEIQNKIKPEYMLKPINNPDEPTQYEGYYEEQPTIVYEMPKE